MPGCDLVGHRGHTSTIPARGEEPHRGRIHPWRPQLGHGLDDSALPVGSGQTGRWHLARSLSWADSREMVDCMPYDYLDMSDTVAEAVVAGSGEWREGAKQGPPAICVITRFGLRHPLLLIPTYLDYRRTVRSARKLRGFLRATFVIEPPRTCYSVSYWTSASAGSQMWSDVPYHVHASRRIFPRLRQTESGRVELWSTRWRLDALSQNLDWPGFDLEALIRAGRSA